MHNCRDKRIALSYSFCRGFVVLGERPLLDLIRIHLSPPARRGDLVSKLIIATSATRIVKSRTSPWEVFLCPEHAARIAIYAPVAPRPTPPSNQKKGK
jgi:hypothetical protein